MNTTVAVPQLSSAVNVSATGTKSHSTVTSTGKVTLNVGARTSIILYVALVVLEFPQSSVAVNTTSIGAEQSDATPV